VVEAGRQVIRGLAVYVAALATVCLLVVHYVSLAAPRSPVAIASVWASGQLVARAEVSAPGQRTTELDAAVAAGGELVYEVVDGEAPILARPSWVFALSLVPSRDGAAFTLDGKTVYVTPDDLVARQAYDHGIEVEGLGLTAGVDVPVLLAMASERFHQSAVTLMERATVKRVRMTRVTPQHPAPPRVTGDSLDAAIVRDAALDAARYLARGIDERGRFRYMVDAPRNRSLPGYDWPRHAGATYFLAQAAALSEDAELRYATLRAASILRDEALTDCGEHRCIADGDLAEIGSSSLAVIAFVEIVRTGLDASYAPAIAQLTAFLRSQQRPDGEFEHQYDRGAKRPIDVQFLYFTGEAALALARAHTLGKAPQDLEASRRALAHLVGPAWSFFGNRYYFGEEHWTCQAMAELWRAAPSAEAFDFCLRWQRFGRRLQHDANDSPQDADGSLGMDPVVTPRLTPVASRCEAAVATLDVATHGGAFVRDEERRALDSQTRRALAFIIRHQFRPGPVHLMVDPAAVRGAVVGSPVDFQLRIDYAQHAGSAMIRWLEVVSAP